MNTATADRSIFLCWGVMVDMAKHTVYTPEIQRFIEENHMHRTSVELARMLNEKFGIETNGERIRGYKRRNGLNSEVQLGVYLFPEEIRQFIHENYVGNGYQDMADLIREKFGVEYPASKFRSYYKNHKLRCGKDTRFSKEYRVDNGCRKGMRAPGCEKGWFKKGHKPASWVPVGTERVRKQGYVWVKVAEPSLWKQKHLILWEEAV